MAQNDIENIKDHVELFHQPEYQQLFEEKKQFEGCHPPDVIERVADWTKGWEYREKNFAREALTVNPAKACQPLGAILAASGFEGTLPFVHGSQGCVAYFRSHFTRHFKEPFSAVSSSMTEDAAVFGGQTNMIEGLANCYNLYKPKMIAVSTTCMAEVIGDDLHAFITNAKHDNSVPADFPVPYAHTPSFVGSHITGYDEMLKNILTTLNPEKPTGSWRNGRINIIPGFETYVGNIREVKRIAKLMDVNINLLADNSDVLDSPNTGTYQMYPGGTPLEDAADAINAEATICMQAYSTVRTRKLLDSWEQPNQVVRPVGIRGTDEFLMKLSALSAKPIPKELEIERGRAVDALTDSQAWLHGKRVALYGDPDLVIGLVQFLLEVGAEAVHIVVSNSNADFETELRALLDTSPSGASATIWGGKDLWHMRSLLFTEPVDLLIGNSYGKYLWRDTKVPFVRIGYPIFDRHHLHRYSIFGYEGTINLLNWIVNTILDELDRNTIIPAKTDISYDLIR
ncbi:MAG: nitrogenase molybdenum-iron protein subunit beta [Synechococcaceae bacterium WB6_3B_236]|nr:nitrogenase molybdenum-iron protein subunit beta [Synechococcaceae bacterium WB6_3B_236]